MQHKKCRQIDCIQGHLFNRISIQSAIVGNSVQNVTEFGNLGIFVYTPTEPSVNVTFMPNMESAEYATYILSCFGTSFGLSVFVLNPVKQSRVIINSFNKTFNRKQSKILIQSTNTLKEFCQYWLSSKRIKLRFLPNLILMEFKPTTR